MRDTKKIEEKLGSLAKRNFNGDTKEELILKKKAGLILEQVTKSWKILDEEAEARIPKFEISGKNYQCENEFCKKYSLKFFYDTLNKYKTLCEELTLGRILGKGGFCVVNEVSAVKIDKNSLDNEIQDKQNQNDFTFATTSSRYGKRSAFRLNQNGEEELQAARVIKDRNFIAHTYLRNGDSRYCIKRITDETYNNPDMFFMGVIDLVIEFKLLAVLCHPHIIKVRGIANRNQYKKNNFIMLDKLYDVMPSRLNSWRKEASKFKNKFKKYSQKLYVKRLKVASDLSSAFVYLHNQKYVTIFVIHCSVPDMKWLKYAFSLYPKHYI